MLCLKGANARAFFKLLLYRSVADAKHTGGATQALPLKVSALNELEGNVTTFLFAIQHPIAATVLAFIGLGATSVFTVPDNIDTLATLTMTMFNNHDTKYTNQLNVYTTLFLFYPPPLHNLI